MDTVNWLVTIMLLRYARLQDPNGILSVATGYRVTSYGRGCLQQWHN